MKFRYARVNEYNEAIQRLSAELGLESEDPIFSMKACEIKLRNLESLKAKQTPATPPPTAPAPATLAKPEAPKATGPTRAQLEQICKTVEPTGGGRAIREDWSDEQVRLEAERILYTWHLHAPFMRSDNELEQEYWRPERERFRAALGVERSLARTAIKKILQKG
jgi:hypothetical protein